MQFNYQVTMGSMTARYYEQVKDYLHPHIHQCINYYRCGNIIDLPLYHGCNRLNRNKTRKEIEYIWVINASFQLINVIGKKQWINRKEEIFTGLGI